MALKGWFGASKRAGHKRSAEGLETGPSIEDLIVLERFDEAEQRLKARLKSNPKDLHAHLRMAEVFTQTKRFSKAVEEYVFVADEYARDGFFDKGLALLSTAARLAPLDRDLPLKIAAYQQIKLLEHKRNAAVDGFRQRQVSDTGGLTAVELQALWPRLAKSDVVGRLPADQLRRLFQWLTTLRRTSGAVLARRGHRGEDLYWIVQGLVQTRVTPAGRATVSLQSFGPGDVLGDAVVFERRPWPADYVAAEDATLLVLTRAALEGTLMGNPDPRGFLSALRFQEKDRQVQQAVARVEAKG